VLPSRRGLPQCMEGGASVDGGLCGRGLVVVIWDDSTVNADVRPNDWIADQLGRMQQ